MLRRFALAVTALAMLGLASSASAEVKVGVGAALNFNAGYVLVPIQITPLLRVEPMAGINTSSGTTTDTSDFALGAGVLFSIARGQAIDVYVGGRLLLDFVGVKVGGVSDSGTDISVAGAVGAECFLNPKFSLGVEADLGYYSNSQISGDNNGLFTRGLFLGRFYF